MFFFLFQFYGENMVLESLHNQSPKQLCIRCELELKIKTRYVRNQLERRKIRNQMAVKCTLFHSVRRGQRGIRAKEEEYDNILKENADKILKSRDRCTTD